MWRKNAGQECRISAITAGDFPNKLGLLKRRFEFLPVVNWFVIYGAIVKPLGEGRLRRPLWRLL